MSQESKSSSERPRTNEYICCQCNTPILAGTYKVFRRTVRPVVSVAKGGTGRHDGIHPWHDGIQVGPEYDYYCLKHYKELPPIQDILDAYQASLSTGSSEVDR